MYTVDSKHFLYYSNECKYSLEVLNLLQQYNVDCMNLVCVDDQHTLPQVVTCVPLIISNSNDVLVDDDVVKFITHLYTRSLDSISALMDDQSAAFSFIDENEEKAEVVKRGFEFIDDGGPGYGGEQQDISKFINIETQGKGKVDGQTFERYAQERERDDSMFKTARPY